MLLAACDALFGLDHVDTVRDANEADASLPSTVIGRYGWLVIAPTGSGSISSATQLSRPSSLRVILDSGTEPMITFDAADNFSFPVEHAGQSYRLLYRGTFDDMAIEIQDNAPDASIVLPILGRPDRTAVTAQTNLNVTVMNTPGGGTALLTSTGIRTRSGLGGVPVAFMFDWRNASSVAGDNALLDAAKFDRVYYAHYGDNTTQHCYFVDAIAGANVTLVNGAPTGINFALAPQTLTRCAKFVPTRVAELARLSAVRPPAGADTTATAWQIVSTPLPDITPFGGIPIVFNNDAASTGEQHQVSYANPYPGEAQILSLISEIDHPVLLPGTTTPATLRSFTSQFTAITDNCSGTAVTATGTTGIPAVATLAGQKLVENTTAVFDRSQLVELAFPTAAPGSIDYYEVDLVELDGIGAATINKSIYRWRVFAPQIAVDPALLATGTTYAFRVTAFSGFPKVVTRDFTSTSYPAGVAVVYTPAFKAP